jgi:hypothetical protein
MTQYTSTLDHIYLPAEMNLSLSSYDFKAESIPLKIEWSQMTELYIINSDFNVDLRVEALLLYKKKMDKEYYEKTVLFMKQTKKWP